MSQDCLVEYSDPVWASATLWAHAHSRALFLSPVGFDFILARDMTDAFTGYDPTNTYVNPDNGTNMVTRFIERAGIAKTTELRELAEHAKTWSTAVDTVLFAPWGQPGRPQIVEATDTVTVRVSTPCTLPTQHESKFPNNQTV